MSDWDPELYLRFMKERTQPVHDLISRIEIERPKRIIDIGCGPGNSTRVLKDRWPSVEIIGLDRSEAMIEKARKDCTDIKFILGNAAGDLSHLGRFDIVFANASLQWIPDHKSLIPRLFDMVSSKGVFAAQIPQFNRMPISDVIKNVVSSPKWSSFVGGVEEGYNFSSDESYYDYLSGRSNKTHMWTTDYYHVMNDHDGIMENDQFNRIETISRRVTERVDYQIFLSPFLKGSDLHIRPKVMERFCFRSNDSLLSLPTVRGSYRKIG